MKSLSILLTLILISFFGYSQSDYSNNQDEKKVSLNVQKSDNNKPDKLKVDDELIESDNPEDFGFEKKIINNKVVYYKKNERVTIIHEPK
jgi:hypothetical protein